MRVRLRCIVVASCVFLSLTSIIPQQHTSLSDAVRNRAIVQQVVVVAQNNATLAAYINTSSAESVLTPV